MIGFQIKNARSFVHAYFRYSLLILLILAVACNKKEQVIYTPGNDIIQLIAGDSSKTWKLAKRFNGKTRMNMEGCFMSYRQTFLRSKKVHDNNGDYPNCGATLEGHWELTTDPEGNHYIKITSDQYPDLLQQPQNYKFFKITYASRDSLQLSFVHNQFGTRRRITDLLVQEDMVVKDRDFHWD